MPRDEIVIVMDAGTVSSLTASGFLLHAAHQVPDAKPVPWLATRDYATNTAVAFTVQYRACAFVELGQVVTYDQCLVSDDGVPGAITLYNASGGIRACSVDVVVNGVDCGTLWTGELLAEMKAVITPKERVLLVFATEPVDLGVVITRTSGPCLSVDMTGAPDNTRTVTYKQGEGWSWEGSWAEVVPP
jgi:hypothetical protein